MATKKKAGKKKAGKKKSSKKKAARQGGKRKARTAAAQASVPYLPQRTESEVVAPAARCEGSPLPHSATPEANARSTRRSDRRATPRPSTSAACVPAVSLGRRRAATRRAACTAGAIRARPGSSWSIICRTRRTLVAFDMRGFGRTQRPDDGYWFPDYLADLDAVLDQCPPDAPVDLVGHSMGGNIAMLYAGVRPQRVRRLVSLEGFGMTRTTPDQAPARYARMARRSEGRQQFRDLRRLRAVRQRARAAQSAHAAGSPRVHRPLLGVAARGRPHRAVGRPAAQARRTPSCISAIRQRLLARDRGADAVRDRRAESELAKRMGRRGERGALARAVSRRSRP